MSSEENYWDCVIALFSFSRVNIWRNEELCVYLRAELIILN
jgi:hypothetical protein